MPDDILIVDHLTKDFGTGNTRVRAVDDLSLTVSRAELVLIMGPSGSGKTTLLSMCGALLHPTSGNIVLEQVNITKLDERKLPGIRARKIGFIFQSFNLLDALTVEENILLPASLVDTDGASVKSHARQLISDLGLTSRKHALPATLSGGEKQRVAIARALINSPPLILADEPTGNLDSHSGQEVMMILHDIVRDKGCSVVMVTHDPRVEELADRILWLEDGALRDRKTEQHVWSTDPVCGMRIDEWTAEVFMEYENRRLVFCSYRCLERFKENPAYYLKQHQINTGEES